VSNPGSGPRQPDALSPADEASALARLVGTVTTGRPVDEREAWSRQVMVAELARLAHPFDERAGPTHVTASGIVVGGRGVVLHRHRRLHRWMQPGGHLEPGEVPEDAVIRECTEETGLTVAHPAGGPVLVHVDVHPAARDHVHLDVRFLLRASDEEPAPAPGESQEVAWFSWEDAAGMADAALAGALVAARRLVVPSPGPAA
jgi:8-oxo-dGTP pyrophosphatase MutT (NUDIX family)